MTATVTRLNPRNKTAKFVCPECFTNAACDCGVTPVSKEEAAAKAIKRYPEKNNQAIADLVGCDEWTVRKAKKEFRGNPETGTRIGKDGKLYPTIKAKRKVTGTGACDYDWENPPEKDFASTNDMYRAQSEHYATEATHLATAYPLLHIPPDKITKAEVKAVQSVAQAWQDLAEQIERRYEETRK